MDIDTLTTARRWHAPVLAMENSPTSDGRRFRRLTQREFPLPLMYQPANLDGHEGAVLIGAIDTITREGDSLSASGPLDTSEQAVEVARMLADGMPLGISIDAAVTGEVMMDETTGIVTYESGEIMGATLVPFPAFAEANRVELEPEPVPAEPEFATTVSFTPLPATQTANTTFTLDPLAVSGATNLKPPRQGAALVSSASGLTLVAAAPSGPPPEWFTNPDLEKRTGLHIEDSGRVWGHLYGWGECHLGSPAGQCIQVPRGGSYAHIVSVDGRGVLCADGTFAQTGPIVLSTDHAALTASWMAAKDHYAHTGTAVADVCCGEDQHGIWIAGVVRPGVEPAQLHALRASAPSGDWRTIGGRLELVAILAVNTPGFPALAASISGDGLVESLVASGAMADCGCHTLTVDPLARYAPILAAMAEREAAAQLSTLETDMGLDPVSVLADLDASME